jgi:hypothetical protein
VAATYDGVRLHPVLLARAVWNDVPDSGARSRRRRRRYSSGILSAASFCRSSAGICSSAALRT